MKGRVGWKWPPDHREILGGESDRSFDLRGYTCGHHIPLPTVLMLCNLAGIILLFFLLYPRRIDLAGPLFTSQVPP